METNILRILSNPVSAAAYGATFKRARRIVSANAYDEGSENVMRAVEEWVTHGTGTITASGKFKSSAIFLADVPKSNARPKWEFFGGTEGAVGWLESRGLYGVDNGNGRRSVLYDIQRNRVVSPNILALPITGAGNAVVEVPRMVRGEPSATEHKFVTTGPLGAFKEAIAKGYPELAQTLEPFDSKLAKIRK